MTGLRVLWSRCAGLFRGRAHDSRLAEEVQAHLDALAATHRAAGLSADEARLAALRDFGGGDQMTERYRDQSRIAWLDAIGRDMRLALRRLGGEPLFSAAVVVALAAGIGGAVSVVSAVTAISLAEPPFREPASVMSLGTIDERGQRADLSWPEFQEARDEARAFDGPAAFSGNFFTIGREDHAPERVPGTFISAGTFRLLGVAPIRGRDLTDQDDRPGAGNAAVRPTLDTFSERFLGRSTDAVPLTLLVVAGLAVAAALVPARRAAALDPLWRCVTTDEGGDMLTVQHLRKSYGGVLALKDLTFTASPGQTIGLLSEWMPPRLRFHRFDDATGVPRCWKPVHGHRPGQREAQCGDREWGERSHEVGAWPCVAIAVAPVTALVLAFGTWNWGAATAAAVALMHVTTSALLVALTFSGYASVPFTRAQALSPDSLKVAAPLGVLALHLYAFRLDDVQQWALRFATGPLWCAGGMVVATLVAVVAGRWWFGRVPTAFEAPSDHAVTLSLSGANQ